MSISKIFSILNFVKKQMMKTDKDGIMKLPSELKAKYGEAVIIKQLMDAGVDPRTIKSEQQLIGVLDSIDAMRAKRTTKPGTTGIMKTKEAEVFDLKGNKLDPDKKITGGTQETEDMIKKKLEKQNKESIKKIKERKFEDAVKAEQDKMAADEDYIPDIIDPDDFAIGGRVGLKKGSMDRRTFLKIMGGLATLPVVGRFFRGAERTAPAVQKVMENFSSKASEAPQYFFDLVAKIKMFGKQSKVGPSDRVDEYSYIGKNGDEYTLTEDIVTGDAQITKDKMGIGTSGDKSFDTINDRTVLEYKAPKRDVDPDAQKFIDEGAEYEEYKIEFDQDGTQAGADAVDEIIQKEIIEEATKSAPPIKKAAGGLAYMLGE
jgi:hypothetical protein